MASKLSPEQADEFVYQSEMKIRKKTEIFYSSASSSKTKGDIRMGPTGEMMLTYRATNALLTNSGCGAVLPAPSWEMPVERELPAKIGQCNKKLLGHNFDRRAKSS